MLLFTACSTPQPPTLKAVYDFGAVQELPAQAQANSAAASSTAAQVALRRAPLALPDIESGSGLDSPALLYRLLYADAQQLRPYAQARWSVPPAQLVRTRLRDALSRHGSVLPTEGSSEWTLRLELDEFSHVFSSPQSSQGLLRLNATLFKGERLIAQTSLLARADAPSHDAPGGVRALRLATDDAIAQINQWLSVQMR